MKPKEPAKRPQNDLFRMELENLIDRRHELVRLSEVIDWDGIASEFGTLYVDRKHEVFGALFLDNRHRVIRVAEMFQGTIDGASVHPRVVAQRALELNAAAIVFFHNHPSGVAEPSNADEAITRRLREALALLDVRVLDHFVVAAGESVSFAESGLL